METAQVSDTPAAAGRLVTIDALRGFAAISVVWYHLTYGDGTFIAAGAFRATGHYGGVAGVYSFFVISGFIIPWALHRAGYTHAGFFRFLGKRMARLDPPYLASIAFLFLLDGVARRIPGFPWHLQSVTPAQLLAHLGYLNSLFGYRWLNNVYWTLGIELQYYVLLAIIFPVAMRLPTRSRWLVPAMLVLAAWLPRPRLGGAPFHDDLILKYLGVFAIGFLCFLHRTRAVDTRAFLIMLAVAGMAVWSRLDAYVAASAVGAALVISFLTIRFRPLTWLGEFSYSLYLFHEPVRWVGFAMVRRYTTAGPIGHDVAAIAILVMAILIARGMYVLVERPSQRWAARLKYSVTPKSGEERPWRRDTPTPTPVIAG